jgi:valine--pyruvate aminotransferase
MTRHTGVVDLMEDLAEALSTRPDMVFMGGGNPGRIPHVESGYQQGVEAVRDDPAARHRLLGVYQSPQGDADFREQVAALLRREYGWRLDADNVAVSNGSQAAFFLLFNMLAGPAETGARHILLPLTPEYIGYADVGVQSGLFRAHRPTIDRFDDHEFKYRVDFSGLPVDEHTGAICVSRPTNPTGNVLTDDEIAHLDAIARDRRIPLIIDGAYGTPFPRIMFTSAEPHWNDNTVLVLSLSKLGLPGVRTGILVADRDLIEAYRNANTVLNLACGNLGPAIAASLIEDDEILRMSREIIGPFYRDKAAATVSWFASVSRNQYCSPIQ